MSEKKTITELSSSSTEKTNVGPIVLKEEELGTAILKSAVLEEYKQIQTETITELSSSSTEKTNVGPIVLKEEEIGPAILKSAVLEEYKQIQTDQQTKECEYANVLAILKERGEEPINSAWLLVLVNDMIQIHNAIRRLDLAVKKSGLKL